jgi:hypothetical protein
VTFSCPPTPSFFLSISTFLNLNIYLKVDWSSLFFSCPSIIHSFVNGFNFLLVFRAHVLKVSWTFLVLSLYTLILSPQHLSNSCPSSALSIICVKAHAREHIFWWQQPSSLCYLFLYLVSPMLEENIETKRIQFFFFIDKREKKSRSGKWEVQSYSKE